MKTKVEDIYGSLENLNQKILHYLNVHKSLISYEKNAYNTIETCFQYLSEDYQMIIINLFEEA